MKKEFIICTWDESHMRKILKKAHKSEFKLFLCEVRKKKYLKPKKLNDLSIEYDLQYPRENIQEFITEK